jgi:glycosyltransferase involved in cell wall biosynthesis
MTMPRPTSPMKITFLLPPVNMSGGIRVITIHAKRLAERGHQVTLVSTPKPKTRKLDHIKAALGLWPAPKSHLDGLGLDHRVLDKARPIVDADVPDADVVVATWWETAEWAAKLSPAKGRKVYFIQGYEIFHKAGADRCRATYRMPFKKIVVARWLARVMADEYGDADSTIVHNSVDHAQFHAPPRGKQPRPTVGFLYSDAEVKGVDVTIRAVDMLRERIPGLRVISFGSSRPETGADKLGEFHFDPPQHMLKDLYAACDVWIAASRSEGFNLTAMEAMACRTPVVSTKTGWPEEAITDGLNGALVEIDDAKGLADHAQAILSLPDERWRAMSQAAFDTVRDSSWERCADQFETALEDAVRQHHGSAAAVPRG